MKKYLMIIAVAVMAIACTKENPSQKENDNPDVRVVTLTASIDQFTKATIDESADGDNKHAFAWESGDQIAIPATGIEGGFAIFTTTGTGSSAEFTCTLTATQALVGGTAKYPATDPGTNFSSIEAAKKAFRMEAEYTLGDASLTFVHKSSLVELNFTNVPDFATSIEVNDGSTTTTITLSNPGTSVKAWVPLTPNGEKNYTFSLKENNNVLKSVSKKNTTLVAGNYVTTPDIQVDKVVLVGVIKYEYEIRNISGWKLHYWNSNSNGDATLVNLGNTTYRSLGSGYWNNDAQPFEMHYAIIPNSTTGFKAWNDGDSDFWYGGDADATQYSKAFVFEYGGNYHAQYE